MYPLARAALFKLDAERAHAATLAALARAPGLARGLYGRRVPTAPVELMGLSLANPVGLAAGWDKDGVAVDALAGLGFGFIEVGTVTPRAQPGNDRPRLFRLADRRALINRLGFNNAGAPALAERLGQRQARAVVGVNIGKNRDTPSADAARDYCAALETVYAVADYVCVNVSSPNTRGLRDLQTAAALDDLLGRLIATRDHCASASGRRLPLAVKIAPDLDDAALDRIAERVIAHRVDGVIATNTTTDRHGVALRWSGQPGGLSGAPLRARSNAVIAALGQRLAGAIPIIGVGGIGSARDAADKFAAGASALQLYTGLVYRGPRLVRECVNAAKNQALE